MYPQQTINSFIPENSPSDNLEEFSNENIKSKEEIEIENLSEESSHRSKTINNFGDVKYKTYTEEFDEVVKAEDLENEEELIRLRNNLDQQLFQLKNFISKIKTCKYPKKNFR